MEISGLGYAKNTSVVRCSANKYCLIHSNNPKVFLKIISGISKDTLKYFSGCFFPCKMTAPPAAHRELNGTATAELNLVKKRFQHFAPDEVLVGLMQHFQKIYKVSRQLNDAYWKPCTYKNVCFFYFCCSS